MYRAIKDILKSLGPGFIIASVVLGPGSITVASRIGSEYGYAFLRVIVLATLLMIITMNIIIAFFINLVLTKPEIAPLAKGFIPSELSPGSLPVVSALMATSFALISVALLIIAILLIGMLVAVFFRGNVIYALITAQASSMLAVPLIAVGLFLMLNNKKVMGDYRNNFLQSIIAVAGFLVVSLMVYFMYQNIAAQLRTT